MQSHGSSGSILRERPKSVSLTSGLPSGCRDVKGFGVRRMFVSQLSLVLARKAWTVDLGAGRVARRMGLRRRPQFWIRRSQIGMSGDLLASSKGVLKKALVLGEGSERGKDVSEAGEYE